MGNQGPTLHIVKSEHDYLFGGCAFETYPAKNGEHKQDDYAFLFQLHPNKIKLKIDGNKHRAIRCKSDSLSLFGNGNGWGADMCIRARNSDNKSHSYLGWTYELPPGYT